MNRKFTDSRKQSEFQNHYERYLITGNREELLSGLYRETYIYCLNRLSRDPDVVGDFMLYLIEGKLEQMISEFQERKHPSFPAFYILCVKNNFRNFIRIHRRRHFEMLPLQTDFLSTRNHLSFNAEEFWHRLEQGLMSLSVIDNLLFRIYHSIPLNSENLKNMVQEFGAERTVEIMEQIEARRRFRENRLTEAEYRMNRFYFRSMRTNSHSRDGRRRADLRCYRNRHWSHSIHSVATWLGMSRQLAAFRLRRAAKQLQLYLMPIAASEF
jgi:hypothetical protein